MPRLPSGRAVALACPLLDDARAGNSEVVWGFAFNLKTLGDLGPLVNIAYFEDSVDQKEPQNAYLSGLLLEHVGTMKCDWSADDVAFFEKWLELETAQEWLQNVFDDLNELIRTVQLPPSEHARGILDSDD